MIKSNGGKYREYTPATAATDSNSQVKEISDTILLLKWKKGSLYSRMMPLNVPCLTIDWLTESIETQYCLLFAGYDIHCDEIQDNFGQFLDEPPIELKWSGLPAEPTFEVSSNFFAYPQFSHSRLDEFLFLSNRVNPKNLRKILINLHRRVSERDLSLTV